MIFHSKFMFKLSAICYNPYLQRHHCLTSTKSVMVSVGVPALGRIAIHFVELRVKVNGQYYRDIMQGLLPGILTFSDYYTF